VPGEVVAYEELVNVNVGDENARDNMLGASLTISFVSDYVYGSYDLASDTFTPEV